MTTKSKKINTSHIVYKHGGDMLCKNCGREQKVPYPIDIPMLTAMSEQFMKAHGNCKKTWSPPAVDMTKSQFEREHWWLQHGERGTSSEAIFRRLATTPFVPAGSNKLGDGRATPRDPGDFNRCHKLLTAVPELKKDLRKMKDVSPQWAALVDNWDKLTKMLEEQILTGNSNGMLEFMDSILSAAKP